MPKQQDRYLAIQVLGAPGAKNDKQAALEFLKWLKDYGAAPFVNKTTDPVAILREGYDTFSKPSWRNRDSNTIFYLQPPWNLPMETFCAEDLDFWNEKAQCTTRITISTSLSSVLKIPLGAYDPIAVETSRLALAIHQKLGAKLSVTDYSDRILEPYPKTMPLWIGWCTIIGKDVRQKYKLDEYLSELPGSIKLEKQGEDLVFTSAQTYSEYVLNGWDQEALAFWPRIGGKLLRKSGKLRVPKQEKSNLFVVKVDKETNTPYLRKIDKFPDDLEKA